MAVFKRESKPVRLIDKSLVGPGRRGSLVKKLQEAFSACATSERDDTHHGPTPI